MLVVVVLLLELAGAAGWEKVNCKGAVLEVDVSVCEAEGKAAGWEKLNPGLELENNPEEDVVVVVV